MLTHSASEFFLPEAEDGGADARATGPMETPERLDLNALKEQLSGQLVAADRIQARPGLSTTWSSLDQFLIWGGLPLGALSLFQGRAGLGATTLWSKCAAQVTQRGRWAAWVNGGRSQLCPWTPRRWGMDFSRLLTVNATKNVRQMAWTLQELMNSTLFDLIGVDLEDAQFSERVLQQLLKTARRQQVALVLLQQQRRLRNPMPFALVLEFHSRGVSVTRAWQRTTPHLLPRRDFYADTLPQLAKTFSPRVGGVDSHLLAARALP